MFKSIAAVSLLASSAMATQMYSAAPVYSAPAAVTTPSTSCTSMWPVTTAVAAPVYSASAMPSEAAAPMTHTVIVGGDAGLVYTPEVIYAAMGDIVEFVFMKQNHSVTQSTFPLPCVKKMGGIDSGLTPNPNNTVVPAPVFKYTVDTLEPTWWYCKQKKGAHCGSGMTFAINPTQEKTYDQFKSMAIAQNGTAATTAAGAQATYAPPSGASSTVTLVAGAPDAVATTVSGSGSGSGGSCQCQCFCGVAAYPSGLGINNYGGMPGSLPAPWATSSMGAAPAATTMGSYGSYKKI